MIILFLLTGLTGIGLVHLQNSRDRAQRKRRSYRSTGKCADDHTDSCCNGNAYAYPCSYSNAYASDHQRTCI